MACATAVSSRQGSTRATTTATTTASRTATRTPAPSTSFDAATGKLTIKLFSGDSVSGLVTGDTEIECDADDSTARSSDHGDDDGDPRRRRPQRPG